MYIVSEKEYTLHLQINSPKLMVSENELWGGYLFF